jgi:curli biogenesis system outer membrane secretion channel CsgG
MRSLSRKSSFQIGLAGALFVLAIPLASSGEVEQTRRLKMRVAVAPLEWGADSIDNWQIPVEFRNAINEKLQKKLLETGRFVILERDALEAVLQEQAIKEENTGQSQKGKIVPAQALFKGKVTDFALNRRGGGGGVNVAGIGRIGGAAADATMAINVRLFDVETSELLLSEEAKGTASRRNFNFGVRIGSTFSDFGAFEESPLGEATTKAIDKVVESIVKKLSDRPWQARVADFDPASKEVVINAGTDAGVQTGDTFEIHRIGRVIKDPETGEILSVRTVVAGKIRIKEVEKKVAIAEVIEGTEFAAGDLVREPR